MAYYGKDSPLDKPWYAAEPGGAIADHLRDIRWSSEPSEVNAKDTAIVIQQASQHAVSAEVIVELPPMNEVGS